MDEICKDVFLEIGKEVAQDVYQDLAQPTTKATGELIGLIPRYINAKLEPLHKWILEKEYNIEVTKRLLAVKLSTINPDKIITPDSYIAIPALQAISYSMDCNEIREMYANLLAVSMNVDIKNTAHPAFVEIIKQLTPDEAKLIKYLSKQMPALIDFEFHFDGGPRYIGKNYININPDLDIKMNEEAYISNLIRLGIIEKIQSEKNSCQKEFEIIEKVIFEECKQEMLEELEHTFSDLELTSAYRPIYYWLQLTSFGEDFCEVCLGIDNVDDD